MDQWFDAIIATYPDNVASFLKQQTDPFANPVGHTLARNISALYEELIGTNDAAKLTPRLDEIIKIRSVQDFSPAAALHFVFLLKNIVRTAWQQEKQAQTNDHALLEFESVIDGCALLGFDRYMYWREKIAEIKIAEIKNRAHLLTRMSHMAGGECETA